MEFSEYGMKYGWLGKQAVLSVEKVVEADKYESFIAYAQNYHQNVEQLIKSKDKQSLKAGATAGAVGAAGQTTVSDGGWQQYRGLFGVHLPCRCGFLG